MEINLNNQVLETLELAKKKKRGPLTGQRIADELLTAEPPIEGLQRLEQWEVNDAVVKSLESLRDQGTITADEGKISAYSTVISLAE